MAGKMGMKTLLAGVVLAIATTLSLVLAASAFATTTLTAPLKVSDDVTHFKMAKLDSSSHEYVKGAKMAIINKETQEVVASWTTGESAFELSKKLDVNTHYILREISAPQGYEVAKDTEFFVNELETEGITIVSGDDAELTASYTVALYDAAKPAENVVNVTRPGGTTTVTGGNTPSSSMNRQVAPKTGDETPLWAVGAGAGVLLVAAGVLQLLKRRQRQTE